MQFDQIRGTLRLVSPGYRRWLTPDMSELELHWRNPPKKLPPLQVRVMITDRDSQQEAQSIRLLEGHPEHFAVPISGFHHSADVMISVENTRDKEPIVEGRWQLTRVDADRAKSLIYFDSRGLMIREGRGTFPIIAHLKQHALRDSEKITEVTAAGFEVVAANLDVLEEAVLAKLKNLRLQVIPIFPIDTDEDKLRSMIREVRELPQILSHGLIMPSTPEAQSLLLDRYRVIRATDPSRPVVAIPGDPIKSQKLPIDFEDVGILSLDDLSNPPLNEGNYLAQFGYCDPKEPVDALDNLVFECAGVRAAGLMMPFDFTFWMEDQNRNWLKWAQDFGRRMIHSVPIQNADEDQSSLKSWQRRFDNNVMIGAINLGKEPLRWSPPNAPSGKSWYRVSSRNTARQLNPQDTEIASGSSVCLVSTPEWKYVNSHNSSK